MFLCVNSTWLIHKSSYFNQTIHFKKGDSIHTENSHKYSFESIKELITSTGLSIKNIYKNDWFALVELERK